MTRTSSFKRGSNFERKNTMFACTIIFLSIISATVTGRGTEGKNVIFGSRHYYGRRTRIGNLTSLGSGSTIPPPPSFVPVLAPMPPPSQVVLCRKPEFLSRFSCGVTTNSVDNITDLIILDVSKIPFNPDQWLHIDVIPTTSAKSSGKSLKINYAMIQISDSLNRIIGRVGEYVPCEDTGHPQYMGGTEEIDQLYRNPGVKHIAVFECPENDLSINSPPTVGIFSFVQSTVESFYVNFKLTKEEADFILNSTKSERIFITTVLVDVLGDCYLHRVGQLEGVLTRKNYTIPPPDVPVKCHEVGPAFQVNHTQSPLTMNQTLNWKDVVFEDQRNVYLRPRNKIPRIIKPDWKDEVGNYNLQVIGIDDEGYTASDREAQAQKIREEEGNETVLRRPSIPLVIADDEADSRTVQKRIFDPEDEECDDKLRINKPENVIDEIGRLYLECVFSRSCVGEPSGCLDDRNCDFVVSWGKEGDYLAFGVIVDRVTYVAIGVSEDVIMDEDSVVECVREKDDVVGYTSWNYKSGMDYGNTRLRSCESMKDFKGVVIGDRIFCSWKRPIVTKVKGRIFDLNKPHYILTARGHIAYEGLYGNIDKHESRRIATPEAKVFNKYIGKAPTQYWLVRIHGILMLIVWMMVAPVATFSSRFLKGTFVNARILGYSVWYGLHLILVTLVIFLTLSSTIVLLIFNNYERTKESSRLNPHSILGWVICLMVLLQTGLSQSQSLLTSKWMNFFHGTIGHLTVICGHACTMTSRDVKDGLPCNTIISYSLYIAFYVILELLMSYQICYSDFVRGREYSRVYKVFIVDADEHDQPRVPHSRRRYSASIRAAAEKKRRINLDDIENIEDGAVINPVVKESTLNEAVFTLERELEEDEDEDEPGSPMRRLIFMIFLWTLGIFTLYYVILMLQPQLYLDCPSQEMVKPGIEYIPGHLYF